MDCSPPGSSVHGILQPRILEWVAMPFSRGSSLLRDWTWVSHIAGRFFTICAVREATIFSFYNQNIFIEHLLEPSSGNIAVSKHTHFCPRKSHSLREESGYVEQQFCVKCRRITWGDHSERACTPECSLPCPLPISLWAGNISLSVSERGSWQTGNEGQFSLMFSIHILLLKHFLCSSDKLLYFGKSKQNPTLLNKQVMVTLHGRKAFSNTFYTWVFRWSISQQA